MSTIVYEDASKKNIRIEIIEFPSQVSMKYDNHENMILNH